MIIKSTQSNVHRRKIMIQKNIFKLHPRVQVLANLLMIEAKYEGLDPIKITNTVITQKEQKEEYPYNSHNWGVAFDIIRDIPYKEYNNRDNWFDKVGRIGKKLGLSWGGDYPYQGGKTHFEYKGFGTWEELMKIYKVPEAFFATWRVEQPLT